MEAPTSQRALISGAVSGVAVDFLLFPLDTVKTRIQSSQGFLKAGGFKGVYRGVGSVGLGSAPGAAAFFVTYENLKKNLKGSPGLVHLASATGAEFVSCLIRVPTEVVKSRTQTGAYGRSSSLHTALQVARNDGLRGFYRGFGITIAREIPFTSIQFPLYEWLKSQVSERPSSGQAALCGMVAGGVAAIGTTPLDVVKTRVMLESRAEGRSPSVLTFPKRLMGIATTEGISALFGGWVPRTMAISVGGAVFLGIYDFAVHFNQ